MRDQLIRYVDLLFAGASDTADMKQEILQNNLDRYDDLLGQGKTPQAAYSLAISGIGDLSEILTQDTQPSADRPSVPDQAVVKGQKTPTWKKIVRALAIFLYIICIIPLLVLDEMGMDTIGLVGTISIVAVATVAMFVSADDEKTDRNEKDTEAWRAAVLTPRQEMRKAVKKAIATLGLVVYFVVSFATGAWHITWLIFPMMSAAQAIVNACMDLKEAKANEI